MLKEIFVMGKFAYLLFVDGRENHNKYYKMTEREADDMFDVEYGRVDVTSSKISYPMCKWNSVYNAKIKKGYKDMSELYIDDETKNAKTENIFEGVDSKEVVSLIEFLMNAAQNAIKENYTISSSKVTRQMIDRAQDILNKIADIQKINIHNKDLAVMPILAVNTLFLELFRILPRKMKKVSDYLLDTTVSGFRETNIEERLSEEQSLLDTMLGQIELENTKNKTESKNSARENILERLNLDIRLVTSKFEKDKVYGLFESNAGNKRKVKRIYAVTNKNTQKEFDKIVKKNKLKTELLFHGSRNQNWFNILRNGLLIRPAGAIITGAMFGNAIYFANKSQKSLGYSSLSGSYWAKGNSSKGFLAIYEVAVGKQKHIYKHDSSCYSLDWEKLRKEGNYDSVYAHGGIDLRNDEFMIYKTNQCTIKYLIELEN